jgi:hypothetical protein
LGLAVGKIKRKNTRKIKEMKKRERNQQKRKESNERELIVNKGKKMKEMD